MTWELLIMNNEHADDLHHIHFTSHTSLRREGFEFDVHFLLQIRKSFWLSWGRISLFIKRWNGEWVRWWWKINKQKVKEKRVDGLTWFLNLACPFCLPIWPYQAEKRNTPPLSKYGLQLAQSVSFSRLLNEERIQCYGHVFADQIQILVWHVDVDHHQNL
jgi:hypothetical protein